MNIQVSKLCSGSLAALGIAAVHSWPASSPSFLSTVTQFWHIFVAPTLQICASNPWKMANFGTLDSGQPLGPGQPLPRGQLLPYFTIVFQLLHLANPWKVANFGTLDSGQPLGLGQLLLSCQLLPCFTIAFQLFCSGQPLGVSSGGHWDSCQPLGNCQLPLGSGTIAKGDRIHSTMHTAVVIEVVIEIVIEVGGSNITSGQLCDRCNFNP